MELACSKLAGMEPFARVADVGCGDGKILLELARLRPGAICEGFDLSERSIAFAQAYAFGVDNVAFSARDFAESSGGYDLILCIETLEHIADEDIPAFARTLRAKLSPRGRLILSVPTTNRPVQAKHYRHYDLALLERHASPSFVVTQRLLTVTRSARESWPRASGTGSSFSGSALRAGLSSPGM
jgi:2-polyprenyl-3-methyl-5-hydroxy-6-metoxy-1,4-benzoquinol methylase